MYLKKYLILFLQLFLCSWMMGINTQAHSRNDTMTIRKKYSFLALGDSYTIGESVNAHERFAAYTVAMLEASGLNFSEPEYLATTGWTTKDLLHAIAQQNPEGPYDVVTLLIGVNDQYQHMDTAGYRTRFTECLQQATRLADNKNDHVFVLSIPDYSVTPFAAGSDTPQISKEIDEFNTINKAITLSHNVSYIEITALSREAKYDASLVAGDGLHPSGNEYAKWAKLLAAEIKNFLL